MSGLFFVKREWAAWLILTLLLGMNSFARADLFTVFDGTYLLENATLGVSLSEEASSKNPAVSAKSNPLALRVVLIKDGLYRLETADGLRALTVELSRSSRGVTLEPIGSSSKQLLRLMEIQSGKYVLIDYSAKAVIGASADSEQLALNYVRRFDEQRDVWHLVPERALRQSAYQVVIKNAYSTKVMTHDATAASQSSTIVQKEFQQGTHQIWDLVQRGNGYVTIHPLKTTAVLADLQRQSESESNIMITTNSADHQEFAIVRQDKAHWILRSKLTGQRLEIRDWYAHDGASLGLTREAVNMSQLWSLHRTSLDSVVEEPAPETVTEPSLETTTEESPESVVKEVASETVAEDESSVTAEETAPKQVYQPDVMTETTQVNAAFEESFDSSEIAAPWSRLDHSVIQEGCGVSGSKCLRIAHKPTSYGSYRIGTYIPLPAAEEYSLQYDVYFEEDFEFVKGGKLPGFAPADPVSGCGTIAPENWSARLMWGRDGVVKPYVYHQDSSSRCGEGPVASNFNFERGQWYSLTVYLKLNQSERSGDGELKLFINGQPVVEYTNLNLRGRINDDTAIRNVFFANFFDGSDRTWSPSKTVYMRFDNIKVLPGLEVRN